METILVTGGAGYLGSVCVPELLTQGYKITVIDNFRYKQNSLNTVCHHKNFEIIKGDVRLKSTMLPLIKKVDYILPLAALVGAPLCNQDPLTATAVNKEAILMMLDNISSQQRIIMPTTNSAYGSGDADNFCDETSPLNPISHYAIEKVEVEKALMEHPNAISYRLATVFGMSPRMRLDLLVNDFTYRAVYDGFLVLFEGNFRRNYIHIRDVARAFSHAITHFDLLKGEIFNVGLSNANLSKLELCAKIKANLPNFHYIEASYGKDPDQRNYVISNKKIENTGYKPQYSINDGIIELIKGYTMLRNSIYSNV
ncbi:NAD-dependent epimerase/dehydratase family protein [Coxiella endosymbiont of Amblyomma nuttalli]|uniref:NAD-dependent epimerase/dehydratase family protein n=1 Tax=Coxiella endosymbiont of Amblyomma nuttalli TaxID=2749996 RepID=UPI001BA6A850|nr:SDR family oxidoreductase [Coxiella endosymbiont of Amblyomma nuttalli]QTS84146.1 CDP-paratose 2-epimerase [Coxiella endosymbiont of Amblyomma nuttalli]